jgi:hypothetical protein
VAAGAGSVERAHPQPGWRQPGLRPTLSNSNHLWWGLSRGANLVLLAGDAVSPPFFVPFPIATDMVALELQDPGFATPGFVNATGANGWQAMTYTDLAHVYRQGDALQPYFGHINTDNPDLRPRRDRGGKVIHFHGWGDQLIAPAGSIRSITTSAWPTWWAARRPPTAARDR